ncbi:hypothetical protein [Arthrobacter polaris]|nr:hypothetical protein [Arthrobacter polaris]UIK89521.1 hypothetical protein J0916_03570 [Arthrobacter polaris]
MFGYAATNYLIVQPIQLLWFAVIGHLGSVLAPVIMIAAVRALLAPD